jgi:hypothetical protein
MIQLRLRFSCAVLTLLVVLCLCGVVPPVQAQAAKGCYFDAASPANDWKDLQECQSRRAQAAVALMLLGAPRDEALAIADDYRGRYFYDTTTGAPLSLEPVAWVVALPDCFRRRTELRGCIESFKYRPDNGVEIPDAEMKKMLENWSECEFWHDCPYAGGAFDPEAMTLEEANNAKYQRIITKARRGAVKKCKAIAVELAKLAAVEKKCSAVRL